VYTVLGRSIKLALAAGYVVSARGAAPPGVIGHVGMAADAARQRDVADVFVRGRGIVPRRESLGRRRESLGRRRESLGPRLVSGDDPADAEDDGDGDGDDREERPDERGGHEGRSVVQQPRKLMSQPFLPALSRRRAVRVAYINLTHR